MKRRTFVKGMSFTAVAVSTTGFVRFNGQHFEGDCETTTDILGPFYRPDAPVRSDLINGSLMGDEVSLHGVIYHDDCKTPLENAKIELWHCDADEVYDNESDEYNYRGTTFASSDGLYKFRTQMPVPYDAGGGNYRPAHFHIMISAPGYQSLVTQLYFRGDPWLDKDPSSKDPNAKSRIFEISKNDNGVIEVPFNVIMQKEFPLESAVLERLAGKYKETERDRTHEFFIHENKLWLKNDLYGINLEYKGDNTFVPSGSSWGSTSIYFMSDDNGRSGLTYKSGNEERKAVKIS